MKNLIFLALLYILFSQGHVFAFYQEPESTQTEHLSKKERRKILKQQQKETQADLNETATEEESLETVPQSIQSEQVQVEQTTEPTNSTNEIIGADNGEKNQEQNTDEVIQEQENNTNNIKESETSVNSTDYYDNQKYDEKRETEKKQNDSFLAYFMLIVVLVVLIRFIKNSRLLRTIFPSLLGDPNNYTHRCSKCGKRFYSRFHDTAKCPNGGKQRIKEL